jgi:predicted nucleotidyltransferase
LAALRLRDRDAILTEEELIFRVFGYSHPPRFFICDLEYGSERVFKSNNPKAPRNAERDVWYKFYEDEGWRFLKKNFPQYLMLNPVIQREVVGVDERDVFIVRKPEEKLRTIMSTAAKDDLLKAVQEVVDTMTERSSLKLHNFGVFGSLLHDFYHPRLSDIDLTVYGKSNVLKLSETLEEEFQSKSFLTNEFESEDSVRAKDWRFRNFTRKEYWQHQRRKLMYGVFDDRRSGRKTKVEFEPVMDWKEITLGYDPTMRIQQVGWVKMEAEVTDDQQSFFIPSVYSIRPQEIFEGPKEAAQATRILSYLEEFRRQATRGELIYTVGNLEKIMTKTESFYQVALTYCPRYYEQVLKVKGLS